MGWLKDLWRMNFGNRSPEHLASKRFIVPVEVDLVGKQYLHKPSTLRLDSSKENLSNTPEGQDEQ